MSQTLPFMEDEMEYRTLKVGQLPPNSQSGDVFIVTPEWASWALEKFNTHNRRMKASAVDRYVADMRAKRWQVTHQGIAFSTPVAVQVDNKVNVQQEFLIDGQNRLASIVTAKLPVAMRVFVGCDPTSQTVVDDGILRTPHDALTLAGIDCGPLEIATANAMRIGVSGGGHLCTKMTKSQMMDFFQKHEKAIRFAVSDCFSTRCKKVTTAPVIAVIARAFYSTDLDLLRQFSKTLSTGIAEQGDQHSRVVISLRNYLIQRTTTTGQTAKVESFEKTQRMLMAYIEGEMLTKVVSCDRDLFPIPIGRKAA